jgi:hypothetical protein
MAKIRRGITALSNLVHEEQQRIKSVNLTNIAVINLFMLCFFFFFRA